MKKLHGFLFLIMLGFTVWSCSKKDDSQEDPGNTEVRSFSGKVQKGPFIKGATITLHELNGNLGQTGRSFTANILTDEGGFEFLNIGVLPGPGLFTANGYYFNELYGKLSPATLSLQALADLGGGSTVNVNVLTHLIKERIITLRSSGLTFAQAKKQAQQELLAFFGITLPDDEQDFETADISAGSELNAAVLAVSVVLQRYTGNLAQVPSLTAELTQLIATMAYDFSGDGLIASQTVKDTLLHNITMANLVTVQQNLEKRYADLGVTASVPAFEPYVKVIQKHLSATVVGDYLFPDLASPYYQFQSDTSAWAPNLLNANTVTFETARDYSVAALVPFDSTLTVKFLFYGGGYSLTMALHGWEMVSKDPTGFTIRSTLQNELITMPVGTAYPGDAVIGFYRNNETSPYRVKQITFL